MKHLSVILLFLVPVVYTPGALAQRGYRSELRHKADSLVQTVEAVPLEAIPEHIKTVQRQIDSLRSLRAHLSDSARVIRERTHPDSLLDLIQNEAFNTLARHNKVVGDENAWSDG